MRYCCSGLLAERKNVVSCMLKDRASSVFTNVIWMVLLLAVRGLGKGALLQTDGAGWERNRLQGQSSGLGDTARL